MSYPNLMAEIERLRQALRNTKKWGKRKRIKAKIKALVFCFGVQPREKLLSRLPIL